METIYFAGGCFWGVERFFQLVPGVTDTEVGYANGSTQNPTYQEVCHENTGHVECVKITYDSREISLDELLGLLYEIIDPTSLNRQGNDVGPQYRTGIYSITEDQREVVEASLDRLQGELGTGRPVMVESKPLENFFTAEQYHQDYLEKNPGGYCHISPRMFELAAEFKTKLDKDKR